MRSLMGNIAVVYCGELELTDAALDQVRFDIESLSRLIQSQQGEAPDMWLAQPDGYLQGGHLLRDSGAIRLIAYCSGARAVYATDGCNACRHVFPEPPEGMSGQDLRSFSSVTQLPYPLLSELVARLDD